MSAARAATPAPAAPGILPLSEIVVRHHGETLFGPMREWVTQKRVPPVLLITGPAGVGKRSVVTWLAQWILCEKTGLNEIKDGMSGGLAEEDGPGLFGDLLGGGSTPEPANESSASAATNDLSGDPVPCGQCVSCQKALKNSWVDFVEIRPEGADDEESGGAPGTLKIDQFRDLKASLGFGAHEGTYKIVSIPNADRMTVQAANSMLKLLEEPPAGWIFFLTASDPTLMLPTVVSRCQRLRLKPFPVNDLQALLAEEKVDPARQPICANLAQGSWSKALRLAEEDIWSRRKTLFSFLMNPQTELNTLVDWASQEPANFDLLVDQLESFLGDLIQWTIRPTPTEPENHNWRNADGRASLAFHAKRTLRSQGNPAGARAFWMDRAAHLARARQEALAPLNRKLLIQDILIPWL